MSTTDSEIKGESEQEGSIPEEPKFENSSTSVDASKGMPSELTSEEKLARITNEEFSSKISTPESKQLAEQEEVPSESKFEENIIANTSKESDSKSSTVETPTFADGGTESPGILTIEVKQIIDPEMKSPEEKLSLDSKHFQDLEAESSVTPNETEKVTTGGTDHSSEKSSLQEKPTTKPGKEKLGELTLEAKPPEMPEKQSFQESTPLTQSLKRARNDTSEEPILEIEPLTKFSKSFEEPQHESKQLAKCGKNDFEEPTLGLKTFSKQGKEALEELTPQLTHFAKRGKEALEEPTAKEGHYVGPGKEPYYFKSMLEDKTLYDFNKHHPATKEPIEPCKVRSKSSLEEKPADSDKSSLSTETGHSLTAPKRCTRIERYRFVPDLHPKEYNHLYKIVLVGETGVGKTSLASCFADALFYYEPDTTVSVGCFYRFMSIGDKIMKLQVWDTPGHKDATSMFPNYFRFADAVVFVFNCLNVKSVENIPTWIKVARNFAEPDSHMYMLCTKIDDNILPDVYKLARGISKRLKIQMFEVCSKTGYGVEEFFINVVERLMVRSEANVRVNVLIHEERKKNLQEIPHQDETFFPCSC